MENHTFTLEKYNGPQSRHTCPECGHRKQFARYINQETGEYLADHAGRCNREAKCGYHFKPKQYFEENPEAVNGVKVRPLPQLQPRNIIQYVPQALLTATLKAYESNNFTKYLNTILTAQEVDQVIDTYKLGTTKDGGCIYWQVDKQGRVRTGKVIHYLNDGHRDKTRAPYFVHGKAGIKEATQCLFGEHLLSISKSVALVESEKTACICSAKFPSLVWLATGGKTNGIETKAEILRGRKVIAFPDSDAQDDWTKRLSGFGFKISRVLIDSLGKESAGQGLDIADFIQPNKTPDKF